MEFIDSHAHLFSEEFDTDREQVIESAITNGIIKMVLPNIDINSIEPMIATCKLFPKNCYAALGLHPTSVGPDYKKQIDAIFQYTADLNYVAIGEIGIDLYWDKTYINEQTDAFIYQVYIAQKLNLPIIIHCRESYNEIITALNSIDKPLPKGIFHSFTGTSDQAKTITDLGFKLGINGVVTYKNSKMNDMIANVPLENIVLETDSPYLPPVPMRGKRNESLYLIYIAQKIADIKQLPIAVIASTTTSNASSLFNFEKRNCYN